MNEKNMKGNTAIHMAIGYDYYKCALLIMDAGGDETLTNEMGAPGRNGLEGDRSLALAALASSENIEDVMAAFKMAESTMKEQNKVNFTSVGMKVKKSLGDKWTPEVQSKLKEIINKINN